MAERRISPWVIVGVAAGVASAVGLAVYVWARPPIPPPPPGLANLYGKVIDAVTGGAIPGVLVTLNGTQVLTDAGGNYIFTDLDPGGYTLQFSKDGYETAVY